MKKMYVLSAVCLAVCLFAVSAFAQSPISLQVKGGMNLANISEIDTPEGSVSINTENLFGYAAGVALRLPIAGSFSLQPEALYSLKGYKTEEIELLSTTSQMKVKMSYIDLPVLGVLSLNEKFDIYGGGYVDFYLDGEVEMEVLSVKDTEDLDSDFIRSPGYGAVVGAAFRTEAIILEARYYHGLSDIMDTDDIVDPDNQSELNVETFEIQHRVIQVLVGFFL